MRQSDFIVMKAKDFAFDRKLFTDKCAIPTLQIAKALWDLAWYLRLKNDVSTPIDELSPLVQKNLKQLSKYIDKFDKPETINEAVNFINYFTAKKGVLECIAEQKTASTVEEFLLSFLQK